MQIDEFIDAERVAIVAEWEAFAGTLLPAVEGKLSSRILRDHVDQILTAIVGDLNEHQTGREQSAKSKGQGSARRMEILGKIHAAVRIQYGFNLDHMVAEYRALRASILRLYAAAKGNDLIGVTRFNEAIDEVLSEGVTHYSLTTEHYRDQAMGILSHDLRAPLASISMSSTLLMDSDDLSDKDARVTLHILRTAGRMQRMIGDLADLTRTQLGDRIPISPSPVDLGVVCREVITEFEVLGPGGLLFTGEGNLRGEWDGERLTQMLGNLVLNAIQHGGDGPVTLTAKEEVKGVVVRVHNAGHAIPIGAQASIFEPMAREVAVGQHPTGLGLELYIVSQIVLSHGGTLRLSSTDTEGTTFEIHLPRRSLPSPRST